MHVRAALSSVAIALTLTAGAARGQEILFHDPTAFGVRAGGGTQFALSPLETPVVGTGALFLNDIPAGVRGVPGVAGVAGTVGGNTLAAATNRLDVSIGFDYLRPQWSFRDFMLAVPPQFAGSFPGLGTTGHVDSHFAFAPRINVNYYVADLDFGVGASGSVINLNGRLQRQFASTGNGLGELDANSSLTIVSANLIEIGRAYRMVDLFPRKESSHPCIADSILGLSIAARYASVDQSYTGTLTGGQVGTSVATRFSTQNFRGIGVAFGGNWSLPCGESFIWFSNLQASVLIGDNRRNSALTVNTSGTPGFSETISETETSVAPVTEVELGVEWGPGLAERLRAGEPPPRFTLRLALVGQHWVGAGPLSAGSTQGFRDSDLFLVGFSLMAALRY